jgi:Phage integrase family
MSTILRFGPSSTRAARVPATRVLTLRDEPLSLCIAPNHAKGDDITRCVALNFAVGKEKRHEHHSPSNDHDQPKRHRAGYLAVLDWNKISFLVQKLLHPLLTEETPIEEMVARGAPATTRSPGKGLKAVLASSSRLSAGLRRVRVHYLRHSYASLLIQDGWPLKYVHEQLGHHSRRRSRGTWTPPVNQAPCPDYALRHDSSVVVAGDGLFVQVLTPALTNS